MSQPYMFIIPRPLADSIDPQAAISNSITKLSGVSQPKGRHGGVHRTAPRATGRRGISGHGGGGLGAEAEVGMRVEGDAISIGKEVCPLVAAEKAVVVGNIRTFALSNTTSFADQVVGLQIIARQLAQAHNRLLWLVRNPKHRHNVLILRLRDELCNDPDIIQ